jgi:hypothetical protein
MADTSLPHPPRVPVLAEPPPVIEPPLVELPPYEGLDVDDLEPLDIEIREGLVGADLVRTARHVAFRDERVRELLAGKRHVVIGLRAVDAKDEGGSLFVLVGYSYDDATAYEVHLSGEGDRLDVVDVLLAQYHPAPADEELEAAIRLARADDRVIRSLEERFEAHALLVSDVAQGDEHHGSRRFSVVFGSRDERLPRVHVVADLVTEQVVGVKMGAYR